MENVKFPTYGEIVNVNLSDGTWALCEEIVFVRHLNGYVISMQTKIILVNINAVVW